MIPHPVKVTILEVAHLTWHLVNRIIQVAILIYYHILSNLEQASKTPDYLSNAYFRIKDLRTPKHIALSFTNEMDQLDLESIARLMCWCKQLDICFITLYDDLGRLKEKQEKLIEIVNMYRLRSFGCMKPISHIEGLNIITRHDGRQKFLQDVREIVKTEPKNVNIDLVQNKVSQGWPSDPELLISFGIPLCLHGFPPWQLRLTEILSIPTHRSLPQKSFIDALKRYSKISQREGA